MLSANHCSIVAHALRYGIGSNGYGSTRDKSEFSNTLSAKPRLATLAALRSPSRIRASPICVRAHRRSFNGIEQYVGISASRCDRRKHLPIDRNRAHRRGAGFHRDCERRRQCHNKRNLECQRDRKWKRGARNNRGKRRIE
jgi:hypothetical protein